MHEGVLAISGRARILAWARDLASTLAWSLVIAISAQVAIPLPFTPVPITLQTLAVLLAGALLGAARGSAAVAVYLAEGAAGLPVFSSGRAGVIHLLGPTGGYLAGFLLAACLVGFLADRRLTRTVLGSLVTILAGTLAIYACGLAWLGASVGYARAVPLGFIPFVPGDSIKSAIGIVILRWAASRRWTA